LVYFEHPLLKMEKSLKWKSPLKCIPINDKCVININCSERWDESKIEMTQLKHLD
jgi:hypothetical protein